jgi:predicted enzyme related to lactoylglutathione lyase
MGHPAQSHKINYVEFSASDVGRAKEFYGTVFGWQFQDWGPEYISFSSESAGIDGGFRLGEATESSNGCAPLIVLYSHDLKSTEDAITAAGGKIVVPTFEFPGGRRFQFSDGLGNVLAVWSE